MKDIIRISTVSQVHKFLGLESPPHPLVSVIQIDDRITNYDYGDVRYVFDFYQINLKLGFDGSMLYGRSSYDFEDGTLTFIKPNQTIQIENQEEIKGSSGWTLLFHPDLFRNSDLARTIDDFSFFDYSLHEALHLSKKERESLSGLVSKIVEECNQNIDKHSHELIVASIDMLLKYCRRFYDRQFITRSNLNADIFSQFNEVIKSYYYSEAPIEHGVLTVKECASKLNLSVNYLSDLLKSETGISAKDHIQNFVVNQAKNRLIGSNEDVRQIAFGLGYEYPQGFNKLFKSKVGVSPSEYRNLN